MFDGAGMVHKRRYWITYREMADVAGLGGQAEIGDAGIGNQSVQLWNRLLLRLLFLMRHKEHHRITAEKNDKEETQPDTGTQQISHSGRS